MHLPFSLRLRGASSDNRTLSIKHTLIKINKTNPDDANIYSLCQQVLGIPRLNTQCMIAMGSYH